MHKPDLEARIAGLSREELANLVSDLAADPTTKGKVVTAVDLAQSLVSDGQTPTRPSFFDRISNTLRRKPKPEALARTSTTSSETLTSTLKAPGKASMESCETITPIPEKPPKTATATLAKNTAKSKTVISDIQVCDNCHRLFRRSMMKETRQGCFGHPGKLEQARNLFQDGERFEQVKEQCADAYTKPYHDPCWTCCLGDKYAVGCKYLYSHACSSPATEKK